MQGVQNCNACIETIIKVKKGQNEKGIILYLQLSYKIKGRVTFFFTLLFRFLVSSSQIFLSFILYRYVFSSLFIVTFY